MVGNVKELVGKHVFDELVDRDVAAHLLEVSPRTLDRWHLLREGPPRIRYGRMVRLSCPPIATEYQRIRRLSGTQDIGHD